MFLFQKVNTNELFENFERELTNPDTILFEEDFDSIYTKEIEKRQKHSEKRPLDSKDSSLEPPSKKAKVEGEVGGKSLPEKSPAISSEPKIVSTTVTTDSLGPEVKFFLKY